MPAYPEYSEVLPTIPAALKGLRASLKSSLQNLEARALTSGRQFFFPVNYLADRRYNTTANGLSLHFMQQSGFDVGEQSHYEFDRLLGRHAVAAGFAGERDDTAIYLQNDGLFTIKSESQGEFPDLSQTQVSIFTVLSVEEALERQLHSGDQYDRKFAERFTKTSPLPALSA